MQIVGDSVQTRAAIWIAERVEKSRHLEGPDPPLIERSFLVVEQSVETGFLGIGVLGLPVYGWLLILTAAAFLGLLVRAIRRRYAANAGAAALLISLAAFLGGPLDPLPDHFYADDPMLVDPDTLAFSAPAPRALSEAYNLLRNTLGTAAAIKGPAVNVNTVGDVPASSWFEERHYADRRSLDALREGPPGQSGPDTSSAWNVVQLERDGKSLGMQIVDGRGERYILKLDAPDFPEVSTGAEVVTSKFLHALGYWVPYNTIVHFELDDLQPGRENVTPRGIERILEQAFLNKDSTYRAIASKYIEGRPIGPFEFVGTRPDDPNDIFPHELRRELRGLRVISAWLNHTDVRAENTLTSAIPVDSGAYVRHYLIDFGTTLGGSPFGEQRPWAGHEYWLDLGARLKRILTFGLYDAEWEDIGVPNIRGVGRFTAEGFQPAAWVPIQANPAFRLMDAGDAFWAAARIGWFKDEEIRAIVEAGEYRDSSTVAYITQVLIDRRDRILREFVSFGGGLDRFRIAGGCVHFSDLLDWVPEGGPERSVRWWNGDRLLLEERATADSLMIPTPDVDRLDVHTPSFGITRIYVQNGAVAGVERCESAGSCDALAKRQALRRELFN